MGQKTTYTIPNKDVSLTTLQKGMVLDLMVDVSSKTLEDLKSMLKETEKTIVRFGLKYYLITITKKIESNILKKLQAHLLQRWSSSMQTIRIHSWNM